MDDNTPLRAVRARFGLTQAALAGWLGLGRSMLAMVEAGQEALPAHARPWLAALALPDAADFPPPPRTPRLRR